MLEISEKKCIQCDDVKDLSDFPKDSSRKDGHSSRCRLCWREYRDQHHKNPNRRRRRPKTYDKEEQKRRHAERTKEWRANNKEHVKELKRQWRQKNPDKVHEMSVRTLQKRLENDPDHYKNHHKRWYDTACRNYRYRTSYGITLEDYNRMFDEQNGKCAICHQPEKRTRKDGSIRPLVVDHNHETGVARQLLCNNCNIALGNFKEDIETLRNAIDYLTKHNQTDSDRNEDEAV